jgi:hypothetical protein
MKFRTSLFSLLLSPTLVMFGLFGFAAVLRYGQNLPGILPMLLLGICCGLVIEGVRLQVSESN